MSDLSHEERAHLYCRSAMFAGIVSGLDSALHEVDAHYAIQIDSFNEDVASLVSIRNRMKRMLDTAEGELKHYKLDFPNEDID